VSGPNSLESCVKIEFSWVQCQHSRLNDDDDDDNNNNNNNNKLLLLNLKNIIVIEEKPYIWFEGIKNYENLDKASLILLYSLILLNLK